MEFEVYINQTHYLGWGHSSKEITIPPKAPEVYRIEVKVNYTDILPILKDILDSGNFRLTIDGHVSANVFFGLLRGHKHIFGFKDFVGEGSGYYEETVYSEEASEFLLV